VALLGGERGIVAQPPKDVFHIDHGIIDQRPNGDGHPAQGHGIDRCPKHLQDEHRGEERQRDSGERDEGCSEVGQKEEHNDHDQKAAVTQSMEDIVDGGFDKIGLPQYRGDLHPFRQFNLEVAEDRFERTGERKRVGAGLLLHPENDRRLRVDRALTPFGGRIHLHATEVGDADRDAVLRGDHHGPDVLRRPHAAQAGD
jgi:hypothetical protein